MIAIIPLDPSHASIAARLHMEGQPGTFLTSLGPDVLTALYQALPQSRGGFGFTALNDGQHVVGFVSATTSVGGLFLEMGTRFAGRFIPPLVARLVRKPSLAVRSIQTLLYPMIAGDGSAGDVSSRGEPTAELLSIMVSSEARSRGVGTLLVERLIEACCERHVRLLDVTVDAANGGARRFYERHCFAHVGSYPLYGREMLHYRRHVKGLPSG